MSYTKNSWGELTKRICIYHYIDRNFEVESRIIDVTHFFNLAVVNSYVLYKERGGNGCLVDFLSDIWRCLMEAVDIPDNLDDEMPLIAKKVRSVRANDVPDAIRLDKYNHWPIQDTTPQRCKNIACARRSRFLCSKCQVHLCVNGKDCFLSFHGIQQA